MLVLSNEIISNALVRGGVFSDMTATRPAVMCRPGRSVLHSAHSLTTIHKHFS